MAISNPQVGDKVILQSDRYASSGYYRGLIGRVTAVTNGSSSSWCVVDFTPNVGICSCWNADLDYVGVGLHPAYDVEPEPQTTVPKQQFVDRDAMWEAIKSVSKGQ